MLFKIIVAHKRTPEDTWEEKYEKNVNGLEGAKSWAKETIESFNTTLLPGEEPRVLIDVIIIDKDAIKDHDWHKTNLVTIKAIFEGADTLYRVANIASLPVRLKCEFGALIHEFRKYSSNGRYGFYDKVECRRCGITGKRYGLGSVTIDSKFRAKVYQRCDTALKHLQSKGEI